MFIFHGKYFKFCGLLGVLLLRLVKNAASEIISSCKEVVQTTTFHAFIDQILRNQSSNIHVNV